MDYKELKDLLDNVLGYEKFDDSTAKKLHFILLKFKLAFVQKNEEHMLFLSSNLTGVYSAAFSQIDSEKFFSIFNVSEKKLQIMINKLPDIEPDWNVTSNPLYLILLYLMHKYEVSKYNKKEDVIILLFELLSYKMLTSILHHFYSVKLTVDEAKAVYEKFTYKFLVKRLGSWDAVIKYKTGMVTKNGTYYKPIENFNTKNAMDVIAAIQTSYRSLIKYIANISHSGNKTKIASSTIIENTSDGKNIRELESQSNYVNYIENIIGFESDFINNGLVKIISNKIKNVDTDNVKTTLSYLSKNHDPKNDYLSKIIEYSLEFLISKNVNKYIGNLEYINILKGYWSSGNPKLKDVKKHVKEASYKATMRKTEWVLNSTTITVITYIFVRAMTKNNI